MALSSKTIRIRGLPLDATVDCLEESLKAAQKPKGRSKLNLLSSCSASQIVKLVCFIARQNDFITATLSFASSNEKSQARKELLKTTGEWTIDDRFDGVTVLWAADEIEIDICAVHGLGGNAFDTWLGDSKMWLRDILPKSVPFDHSRVMTFGYDSTLINRRNNDRIKDWAEELLKKVGQVRTTEEEQRRPIIFICHSLGGLVGREAMIHLNQYGPQFDGLKLDRCGLIFLSTPHSGTTQADWNEFLMNLSEITLGIRSHTIIDQLRSFNPSTVDAEKAFKAMARMPPLHCFCEGSNTAIVGKSRLVVTQASAGFCGHTADKILNVDHHQICKFDTQFGGYMDVLAQMKKIRGKLLLPDFSEPGHPLSEQNLPGQPSIVAPFYPLNRNTKWYEGSHLHATSQLVGRNNTLEHIITSLNKVPEQPKIVALTGIGGIGKTEILLEIAVRFKNISNVFFVRASDKESFEGALLDIASSIGHDLLAHRYPNTDLATIWRAYEPKERIQAFKTWLAHPANQPSLFIVDDLDGLQDESLIQVALPHEAQIILYSTRDPSLLGGFGRESQDYLVSTMEVDEMASLMSQALHKSGQRFVNALISEHELEAIANVVDGHALGACRAITYITQSLAQTSQQPAAAFLEIFEGSNWEGRKRFLEYKPRIGISIMETYNISFQRIRQHKDRASRLFELLAFLSSGEKSCDFRKFLSLRRPWLGELQMLLPDYDVFAIDIAERGEYLSELENVSLGVRDHFTNPLQIHPLWLECTRQRVEHDGRVRWLRQILLLCHMSWSRNEQEHFGILLPFAENAVAIADRFRVKRHEITDSEHVIHWVMTSYDGGSQEREKKDDAKRGFLEAKTLQAPLDREPRSGNTDDGHKGVRSDLFTLQQSCERELESLSALEVEKLSETAFEAILQRYIGLLRRTRKLETELMAVPVKPPDIIAKHRNIYDLLIQMAPTFEVRNPALSLHLKGMRQKLSDI